MVPFAKSRSGQGIEIGKKSGKQYEIGVNSF